MITVFLPCRLGSQRIPNKNTKAFVKKNMSLLSVKLNQLIKVKNIDQIVVSTNDPTVINLTKKISENIIIDIRPDKLALSTTSTDELIKYIPKIITQGHILWTHTTSPFLNEEIYEKTIDLYFNLLEKNSHDSLMTVNTLQTFLWNYKGSLNYDRHREKWPRTQTLKKVFEVNSGIFINSIKNYNKYEDRIGNKPFLYELDGYASFDIDWPKDFGLAELIYKKINRK